eukprot:TRINITY_DN2317_c0_g1_i1.p1 TRINITY_DN2317_c0_g1~~TRINITY_DN2317_c0_g1_i1.p1  ORF type:complete len:414 (+),score=106.70 TRINITY_DN2317_c0_g1_i1:96-1337(+)
MGIVLGGYMVTAFATCMPCARNSKCAKRFQLPLKVPWLHYLTMFVCSLILCTVWSGNGHKVMNRISVSSYGTCDSSETCLDNQAVFRTSFIAVVLNIISFALFFISTHVYSEYWVAKSAAFVGIGVGLFYINMSFYKVYANIARVVSWFSLLFIIYIILELCNVADDHFREARQTSKKAKILYGLLVGTLFGASAIFNGVGYYWYPGSECSQQIIFISVTFGICGLSTIIGFVSKKAKLLPQGAIVFLATWLLFQSLDQTSGACKVNSNLSHSGVIPQALEFFYVLLSIGYTTRLATYVYDKLIEKRNKERESQEEVELIVENSAQNQAQVEEDSGAAAAAPARAEQQDADADAKPEIDGVAEIELSKQVSAQQEFENVVEKLYAGEIDAVKKNPMFVQAIVKFHMTLILASL